jgi:secreted trypsin-like serine protease
MVRNAASLLIVGVLVMVLSASQIPAGATRPARDVVGGDQAPEGKFPWMVRLSMGCGGALTAPSVVLTAGHCVQGTGPDTTIEVTAGSVDLKSSGTITAHSVEVIRAPDFSGETRGNDWAVIKLDRPLGLATLGLTQGERGNRGPFTIMGWGQISEGSLRQQNRLRYAEVPVVADAECAKDYRQAGVELVPSDSVCAGKPGVDTCQGDSGGPMVRRDAKGRWLQAGIVSWGLGCARDKFPGVYTQISTFRQQIKEATRQLS